MLDSILFSKYLPSPFLQRVRSSARSSENSTTKPAFSSSDPFDVVSLGGGAGVLQKRGEFSAEGVTPTRALECLSLDR